MYHVYLIQFVIYSLVYLVGQTYKFFADQLNYEEYRENEEGQRIVYRRVEKNATLECDVKDQEIQQDLQRCYDSDQFNSLDALDCLFHSIHAEPTGEYSLRFPKCSEPLTRQEKAQLKKSFKRYQETGDGSPSTFFEEQGFVDNGHGLVLSLPSSFSPQIDAG